ncbi:MAG: hypothetical protein GX434_14245 [Peptococcaceae bacterium]|nr:hypothetical protein [Peptococcaceae bacterium]
MREETKYTKAAGRLLIHLRLERMINNIEKMSETSKNITFMAGGNANSPALKEVKPSAIRRVCSQWWEDAIIANNTEPIAFKMVFSFFLLPVIFILLILNSIPPLSLAAQIVMKKIVCDIHYIRYD